MEKNGIVCSVERLRSLGTLQKGHWCRHGSSVGGGGGVSRSDASLSKVEEVMGRVYSSHGVFPSPFFAHSPPLSLSLSFSLFIYVCLFNTHTHTHTHTLCLLYIRLGDMSFGSLHHCGALDGVMEAQNTLKYQSQLNPSVDGVAKGGMGVRTPLHTIVTRGKERRKLIHSL